MLLGWLGGPGLRSLAERCVMVAEAVGMFRDCSEEALWCSDCSDALRAWPTSAACTPQRHVGVLHTTFVPWYCAKRSGFGANAACAPYTSTPQVQGQTGTPATRTWTENAMVQDQGSADQLE